LRRRYRSLEDLRVHHIIRPITESWNHLQINSKLMPITKKTSTGERSCDMKYIVPTNFHPRSYKLCSSHYPIVWRTCVS
jgi:hypothetical protein